MSYSLTNLASNISAINGNVGIGTTNPYGKLHLHNTVSAQDVRIILSDNTTTASGTRGFQMIKDSTGLCSLWNYENKDMRIASGNSDGLRIINANVAIGSTIANYRLDVNGTVNALEFRLNGTVFTGGGAEWKSLNSITYTTYNVGIGTSLTAGNDKLVVYGNNINVINGDILRTTSNANTLISENYQLRRWVDSPTYNQLNGCNFVYYDDGNVGIGTTNPKSILDVNGDIYCSNLLARDDVIANYSDIRLKTIVSKIETPLDLINDISVFKYTANALARSFDIVSDRVEVGVSAQDVQSVLPEVVRLAPFDTCNLPSGEAVSKSGDNYLTVSYGRLVPLLIECIKTINKERDDIRKRIELLENGSYYYVNNK